MWQHSQMVKNNGKIMENTIYKISKEKHSHINTTEHNETNHQQVVIETGLFVDKLADNKDIISCCCCCDIVYTCVGEEEDSSMCDYNNTLSGKCDGQVHN